MSFPTSYISIHMINVVSASATGATGNPVKLNIKGRFSDTEITLFVSSPEYAQRLATAINDAVNAGELNEL